MSKKQRAPKTGPVWRQSADEVTLAKKPHYNGFACGHGAHGDAKYCRAKEKREWKKQLRREGASHEAPSFDMGTTLSVRNVVPMSKARLRQTVTTEDRLLHALGTTLLHGFAPCAFSRNFPAR